MSLNVTCHLNFRGQAREALAFYQSVFGGELVVIPHQDSELVMWGQVAAPSGFAVMAYDVPADLAFDRGERSFFVSIRGEDADAIQAAWSGLAAGAEIVVPLATSAWSPLYGMLVDRFGVTWVLDVAA